MEPKHKSTIQGALGPLLGDLGGSKDYTSDDTGAKEPSTAPVGVSEVRGRNSRDIEAAKKKTKKVLESWAQGPNKGAKRSATGPRGLGKRDVEDSQRRGFHDIGLWFERKGTAQEEVTGRKDQKKDPEVELKVE